MHTLARMCVGREILVKEHGCIYGWMNGTNSDNAVSIQTMATQKVPSSLIR